MTHHQTVSLKLAAFSLITLGLLAVVLYGQAPAAPPAKPAAAKAKPEVACNGWIDSDGHCRVDSPKPAAAKEATKPKDTPKISPEVQAKFWKAQSAMQAADEQQRVATQDNQQKHVAFNAVVMEMRGVCGDGFNLNMSSDNDPVCQAKPAEPVKK